MAARDVDALDIKALLQVALDERPRDDVAERVMSRVAAYYERELDKRLAAFARAVEPMMLIVMGAVVGLIVSSLILPIFKLSRAVG